MSITRLKLNGLINNSAINQLGAGALVTVGDVFYVSSALGSDGNVGTDPKFPLATVAQAQTNATASHGDIVLIMPGYTQTRTTVLTLSKAGVTYIGLGNGSLKPTFTHNAATDCVNITAANVILSNIHFAAPLTDAQTAMINVAAANVSLLNISGIGSVATENIVDCITIASGANDLTIDGLEIYNTAVAVNSFISIEAAVARLRVFNAFCFGDTATGGIIDGATATQIHFNNVVIATIGTTQPAAVLDSNPTGLIENSKFAGTSTTLANNAALGTGVRLFNVWVTEETDGSKQGAQIPAVDVD